MGAIIAQNGGLEDSGGWSGGRGGLGVDCRFSSLALGVGMQGALGMDYRFPPFSRGQARAGWEWM
jgi:hypothetical protein